MKVFLSRALFPILACASLAACGGGSPTGPSAGPPTPAPTPAATARFSVTFETAWSEATHPQDFPPNPHFSPLIGATHSARLQVWQVGVLATDGIEAMAELGRVSPLDAELEAAVAQGRAHQVIRGSGVNPAPGSSAVEFEVVRDHPLLTLVTMVAPSPDWFTGVHDLSLVEGGDWVAERVVTLFPYDAGTDHGVTYNSRDRDAQPRDPITRIASAPLAHQGSVAPVGTYVIRRLR